MLVPVPARSGRCQGAVIKDLTLELPRGGAWRMPCGRAPRGAARPASHSLYMSGDSQRRVSRNLQPQVVRGGHSVLWPPLFLQNDPGSPWCFQGQGGIVFPDVRYRFKFDPYVGIDYVETMVTCDSATLGSPRTPWQVWLGCA